MKLPCKSKWALVSMDSSVSCGMFSQNNLLSKMFPKLSGLYSSPSSFSIIMWWWIQHAYTMSSISWGCYKHDGFWMIPHWPCKTPKLLSTLCIASWVWVKLLCLATCGSRKIAWSMSIWGKSHLLGDNNGVPISINIKPYIIGRSKQHIPNERRPIQYINIIIST